MDPLYCFKFDIENNKIEKVTIKDYTINNYSFRKSYKFKNTVNKAGKFYLVGDSKLDRYVSGKVFTFNNDVAYVKDIILSTLNAQLEKAKKECEKYTNIIEVLKSVK